MTDWPDIVLRSLQLVVGAAFQLGFLFVAFRLFKWWAYERQPIQRGGPPAPRILMRRLWCKHRVTFRTRDPYGRHYTGCASCGVDVNAGKPWEERR